MINPWEAGNLRWTQGSAAFVLRVEGTVLRLPVARPLVPEAVGLQAVDFWLDGPPAGHLVLDTADWRVIEIPVHKPRGGTVIVRLRTAYTAVPAALGVNADGRRLGVLMKPIRWADR